SDRRTGDRESVTIAFRENNQSGTASLDQQRYAVHSLTSFTWSESAEVRPHSESPISVVSDVVDDPDDDFPLRCNVISRRRRRPVSRGSNVTLMPSRRRLGASR